MEAIPVLSTERYTYDYDTKSGVTLEFKAKENVRRV
jgi:hypothetical protein